MRWPLGEAALAEARSIGAEATSAVVAALLDAELTSPSDEWTPLAAVYLATELRLAGTVPSRNDPCHCGSGKKYKKCHLAEDEDRERSARAT